MAINPEAAFVGKITPSSASYPFGEARNVTAPGDGKGTPWVALLLNDLFGFQQAILGEAGITPSGSSDTALVSQYLAGLKGITAAPVNNMLDLVGIPADERKFSVMLGFFVTFPQSQFRGGGLFAWESGLAKSNANGGTIIDPDNTGGFDGTVSTRNAFLAAQGGGGGNGCWVKEDTGSITLEDFGAVGDGVTVDTAAFTAAAALSRPVSFGYGNFILDAPVTFQTHLQALGLDTNQSTITFTGTGQLVVGDEHAIWGGFLCESAVDNLIFIKNPGISNWTFRNFRIQKTGGATGQTGIQFDTSISSIFTNHVSGFRFRVDSPVRITGNGTQSFNANQIGASLADYWFDFNTALSSSGQINTDGNHFAGYLEQGNEFLSFSAGSLRQNRFDLLPDNVPTVISSSVAITAKNWWNLQEEGAFVTSGTYPKNQTVVGDESNTTRIRATDASGQSIPNAVAAGITFDTETFDTLDEFVNGTGIFTPKNQGYYRISASLLSASAAWTSTERWEIFVYKNGAEYAKGDRSVADATVSKQMSSDVQTDVFMNGTTDTLQIRVIHNQGAAVALDTVATANYVDIHRI